MPYISVRNWKKFQHYSDRNPPWIKTYTELMSNEDYLGLTGHQRGVLSGLWLTYASSQAHLKLDTRTLTYRLRLRVTTSDIEALVDAGFIDIVDSKSMAEGYQGDGADADAHAPRNMNKGSQKNLKPSTAEQGRSKTTTELGPAEDEASNNMSQVDEWDVEESPPHELVRFNDGDSLAPIGDTVEQLRRELNSS